MGQTFAELSEALVKPIEVGDCLDHCVRGITFADGLPSVSPPIKVEIVHAIVEGQDAGKARKLLHCWVEVEQEGRTVVMDATIRGKARITERAEYYADRKPTDI